MEFAIARIGWNLMCGINGIRHIGEHNQQIILVGHIKSSNLSA
jgi:hypothetical protein